MQNSLLIYRAMTRIGTNKCMYVTHTNKVTTDRHVDKQSYEHILLTGRQTDRNKHILLTTGR